MMNRTERRCNCNVILYYVCNFNQISGKFHVVTEFCPGGALRDLLLKSRVHLSENLPKYVNLASTLHQNDLLKFAADISNGMAHLSSQKVVYRFFL